MKIIYSHSPLNSKEPDYMYQNEYNVAKTLGMNISLFSYEDLVDYNDPEKSIKNILPTDKISSALYRGWMLKPEKYLILYNALLSKNIKLINSPENYKYCHYLPESYELIKNLTPRTIWFTKEQIEIGFDLILEKIKKVFGRSALVIKDYVKSRKHEWNDACYISDASSTSNVSYVIKNFLQRQGKNFNKGLVVREFLELAFLTYHHKSKMPLTKEFRLFFLNGKLMQVMYYWDEGNYTDLNPELTRFCDIAKNVKSNFFTMDIAQTINNQWIIIELGDGQVSALPDNANLKLFYSKINQLN